MGDFIEGEVLLNQLGPSHDKTFCNAYNDIEQGTTYKAFHRFRIGAVQLEEQFSSDKRAQKVQETLCNLDIDTSLFSKIAARLE